MSLNRVLIAGSGLAIAIAVGMMSGLGDPNKVSTASMMSSSSKSESKGTSSRTSDSIQVSSGEPMQISAASTQADRDLTLKLRHFADLKEKFSLSESEKRERSMMLDDRAFLQSLGPKILSFASSTAMVEEQDAALDVLIATLSEGDRHTGDYILREVVSDSLIEDGTVELSRREQRAGVVGEILYRWTAQLPEDKSGLLAALPGAASRRVWENVERMHAQNREASLASTENDL